MTDDIDMPSEQSGSAPKDDTTYTVGYGRPPKKGQFKKGQSGNPKGRPKGGRNLSHEIRDVYLGTVSINAGGKVQKVSRFAALFFKRWERGIKGDERAAAGFIASAEKFGLHIDPLTADQLPDEGLTDEEFMSLSDQARKEIIQIYEKKEANRER
jgi:hypothetical protein